MPTVMLYEKQHINTAITIGYVCKLLRLKHILNALIEHSKR